jgi:hypothetical protein
VPRPISVCFRADPGHGWLKVRRSVVRRVLGDQFHQITPFSHQRGDFLYLEEDCDAGLFLRTAETKGFVADIREMTHSNQGSRIRNYDSFALREGE